MFVLMWAMLLFSVKDGGADTGASLESRTFCYGSYCITLSDGEIRAEAGLCVVIPCSFTTSNYFTPQSIEWFKCELQELRCKETDIIFSKISRVQSGFRGRVKQLESNIYQRNCSIIINDVTASDSGSYQLKVHGYNHDWRSERFQYTAKATVSVEDLTQKPTVMVPPLTEGQETTLSCTAPGLCSGSAPEITWMWRGRAGLNVSNIRENFKTERLSSFEQRHSSTLTFTPSAEHHGTDITCKVRFKNSISTEATKTLKVTCKAENFMNASPTCGPPSVLPWAVAAVSLIVNVVLIICLVFLWTKRKKVNSNQEDRTYMSLQKTDRSPEYDVICQPVN